MMKPAELLQKGLLETGIDLSAAQTDAFMMYLAELKKWNKTYNLTSLKTDRDIVIKHFIDSLLYIKAIPQHTASIADIGSGAGFPGIPLKIIMPETEVTLIEPVKKKSAFLRHMVRTLKLKKIRVLEQRVEDIAGEYEKPYDIIVSRATFSIREFLDMSAAHCSQTSRLIVSKGPKVFEELNDLETHPHPACTAKELHRLRLPLSGDERNLVVLQCRNTSEKIPESTKAIC